MKKILLILFISLIEVSPSFSDYSPLSVGIILNGIKTNEAWFSPNYDGSQDTVSIGFDIKGGNLLQGWSVSIYNSLHQAVWVRIGERNRDVPLDPGVFWKKLWAKKENVSIPDAIVWDGRADNGVILPEGSYFLVASAWDEMKNIAVSETDKIILDITPPQGSLSIYDTIFYPNTGGKRGLFFIRQNLSTNGFWRSEMRNREGRIIKNWDWGRNPPATLEWDGGGNDGTIQPEGTYDYIVYGWDQAGNRTVMPLPGINLSQKVCSVFLSSERPGFSPTAPNPLNEIRFIPSVSMTNDLLSWNLKIRDKNFKLYKELKGEVLPAFIIWDGRDDGLKIAPDGLYNCSLSCVYTSGDTVFSAVNTILIGSSSPELSISAEPLPFSPDIDGINDPLKIHFNAKSPVGIKKWRILIYDPDNKPFKTFEGYGGAEPAQVLTWDGRSDNGELVESAENYRIIATAVDSLGNGAEKEIDGGINIDVLAEKTERGYRIRINNIEFDFAKAGLKQKKTFILDRVAEILKKYSNYKVEIQGHTDNIGSIKKNIALSGERAKNVYNYLVMKGISKKRLSYKGFAYSFPIAENSTDEGRRKNRRVEFILLKE